MGSDLIIEIFQTACRFQISILARRSWLLLKYPVTAARSFPASTLPFPSPAHPNPNLLPFLTPCQVLFPFEPMITLVADISQPLLLIRLFRKLGAVPYGHNPDGLSLYTVKEPIWSNNDLPKW